MPGVLQQEEAPTTSLTNTSHRSGCHLCSLPFGTMPSTSMSVSRSVKLYWLDTTGESSFRLYVPVDVRPLVVATYLWGKFIHLRHESSTDLLASSCDMSPLPCSNMFRDPTTNLFWLFAASKQNFTNIAPFWRVEGDGRSEANDHHLWHGHGHMKMTAASPSLWFLDQLTPWPTKATDSRLDPSTTTAAFMRTWSVTTCSCSLPEREGSGSRSDHCTTGTWGLRICWGGATVMFEASRFWTVKRYASPPVDLFGKRSPCHRMQLLPQPGYR